VDHARLDYLRELYRELTDDDDEATARAAVTIGVWLAGHYMRFDTGGLDHDTVLDLVFDRTTSGAR
jgi:hypothetical protein